MGSDNVSRRIYQDFPRVLVEPTVRIGWSKSDFQQNRRRTLQQTQLTLSQPAQTIANPLTEAFAETN
jgi:hypothetical protein